MANNGGYRDEREAMAARLEELQRENSALGEQASQLGFVQRENAELRRRLGEPGARPPRNRTNALLFGGLAALFALACVAGMLMFGLRSSSSSASAPVQRVESYAPPVIAAPVAVPAPAPTPVVEVPAVPPVEPRTR